MVKSLLPGSLTVLGVYKFSHKTKLMMLLNLLLNAQAEFPILLELENVLRENLTSF